MKKDLFNKEVFVLVYDNLQEVQEDMFCTCFNVPAEKLNLFLEICKYNGKYVQIEIDYSEVE